jgi:CRP-like cAMP-binding protein
MQADPQTLEELRHIYLFASLAEEQLNKMLESAYPLELEQKQVLFEAGQAAEHFYLLRSGQIKLFLISPSGDEKVIEIVRPGETFAEAITFMEQQAYPVSAEAIMNSALYCFKMKTFRQILEDSPPTCQFNRKLFPAFCQGCLSKV